MDYLVSSTTFFFVLCHSNVENPSGGKQNQRENHFSFDFSSLIINSSLSRGRFSLSLSHSHTRSVQVSSPSPSPLLENIVRVVKAVLHNYSSNIIFIINHQMIKKLCSDFIELDSNRIESKRKEFLC